MISKQTPTRMARLVAQWRRSGQSQASFARRHQLRTWTFWYWCRKLSRQVPVDGDPPPTATFVPVVQSCKLIDVSPFAYLKDVLLRVATRPHRLIHQLTAQGWNATFGPRAGA